VVAWVARGAVLIGPTVLAFDSGGYFGAARTAAGISAWILVALLALGAARPPLPRSGPGIAALAGLALLTGWVALSRTWAPLDGPAGDDLERYLLYVGVFLAAVALWDDRRAARLVEPALASGAFVVIAYGLAGRLLPGVIELKRSLSAAGRLEQPLTYWNAEGALAAIGLVLCIRLMGDRSRPAGLRTAAAGAAPVLALGLYLSFSRGALAAFAAGLGALVLLDRDRSQLRACALALAGGGLAAGLVSLLPGVEALEGGLGARERDGLVMLALLAALCAGSALLGRRAAGASRIAAPVRLPPPVVAAVAVAAVVAGVIVAVAVGDRAPNPARSATAGRLTHVGSNRYRYWDVALHAFRSHPLRGVGTSGFAVEWLEHRDVDEPARDAHSLYLETAAELGLVGLALLALFAGGLVAAARRAYSADPALAAGWCAGLLTFAVHAGLDWDWEMPAVTLPALVLAAALANRSIRGEPATVSSPA
jgi:O-antigen ligase/polysaccharide polymerase Wzy-like membrane protein